MNESHARPFGAKPRGAASERAKEAFRLYLGGMTMKEIALRYGVTAGTIERDIAAAREEARGK
jgi:transposase